MRHITLQIQELLEALHDLRLQQKALLSCTESGEVDALPETDLEIYQKLEREREAKAKFLSQITGSEDDLNILLDQLSRLAEERRSIMARNKIDNALELPLRDLLRYTRSWEHSDFVAGLLEDCLKIGDE